MSDRWVNIQLAHKLKLKIHKNLVFGQLSSGQIVSIRPISGISYLIQFVLRPEIRPELLAQKIEEFNRLKLGKASIKNNALIIERIIERAFLPDKLLAKVFNIISIWDNNLNSIQTFPDLNDVCLVRGRISSKGISDSILGVGKQAGFILGFIDFFLHKETSEGRFVDERDLKVGEVRKKKESIKSYGLKMVFLLSIIVFVHMLLMGHKYYFSHITGQLVIGMISLPIFIYLSISNIQKKIGLSMFRKYEGERNFELFDDWVFVFFTSFYFTLSLVLVLNLLNIFGDPYSQIEVTSTLSSRTKDKSYGCEEVIILKISDSEMIDYKSCNPLKGVKEGERVALLKGKGLFEFTYYQFPPYSSFLKQQDPP